MPDRDWQWSVCKDERQMRDKFNGTWQDLVMATISIDTHSAFVRLTQSGFPDKQAQAVVATLQDATLQNVATKEDIQSLHHDLLRLKIDMLKWIVPLLLGQIAVFAGIVSWLI